MDVLALRSKGKTQSKSVPGKQARSGWLSLPWTESFCCCVQKSEGFLQESQSRKTSTPQRGQTGSHSGDDFYHFLLDESVHAMPSAASKLFTTLSLSVSGDSFTDIKFQVDSAATCNTSPYHHFKRLGKVVDLQPTSAKLISYSG